MNIEALTTELEGLHCEIVAQEPRLHALASQAHPNFQRSALNLGRYLILRSHDLRKLHAPLSDLGLSSLRSAEGYVLSNLQQVLGHLKRMEGLPWDPPCQDHLIGFQGSRNLLSRHAEALFGPGSRSGRPAIMVTMSETFIENPEPLKELMRSGMRVARINLARDSQPVWERMLQCLRTAEKETGLPLKIYMDLAGPKIRIRFPGATLPLEKGTRLEILREGVPAKAFEAALARQPEAAIPVTCSLPSILDSLQAEDRLSMADGQVRARVVGPTPQGIMLEVEHAYKPELKNEKGLNIPGRDLKLPSLTPSDIANLPFAMAHADLLGYSFVNQPEDVAELYRHLDALGTNSPAVILKIETARAFDNLPAILLEGMKRDRVGVMVARGDLAVEVGFDRISEVQSEILWFCEAAHVPVIWATQVLDSLAKKGIATRAEISDVALGTRAECIMLNKGKHILEAVRILKTILDRMQAHVSKKKDTSRMLEVAHRNYQALLAEEDPLPGR